MTQITSSETLDTNGHAQLQSFSYLLVNIRFYSQKSYMNKLNAVKFYILKWWDNKNWLLRNSMAMGKSKVCHEKICNVEDAVEGDPVRPDTSGWHLEPLFLDKINPVHATLYN